MFRMIKTLLRTLFPSLRIEGSSPTVSDRGRIFLAFRDHLECPCCGTREKFLSGPSGGMSTNVMCEACGTRLNVAMFGDFTHLEWTHGPQPDIWGGRKPTKFPDPERVEWVRQALSDRE